MTALEEARLRLDAMVRRHSDAQQGFMPNRGTLETISADINQAMDEVERLELEAALGRG